MFFLQKGLVKVLDRGVSEAEEFETGILNKKDALWRGLLLDRIGQY